MRVILHFTTKDLWSKAQQLGRYECPSLAEEGFIHCSYQNQVPGVFARYFSDVKQRLILLIDTGLVTAEIKEEGRTELFPHIYGPMNLDAVRGIYPIPDSMKLWDWPSGLREQISDPSVE